MSAINPATKGKAALKQPVQRISKVRRLDSVKNPQPRPIPEGIRRAAAARAGKAVTLQCTNKQCPQSDVDEDDGKLVCKTCGVVVQDAQITSEIQFLDMANGSVAVQGSYVGANEEHARNSALGNSKITGGMDSRQVTLRNGNNAIRMIADGLRLSDTHKTRALSLYTLAAGINFIQGREINHVAAACLYIACRMDDQNRMMLIDFSDALQVNVFKLGQTYTTLVQELGLREKRGIGEINPEGLIYRFADELELGNDKAKVAEEAVRILKRMERDWMTPGRRPSGVCGAAIILAARMNNHRRTVRELVYIAKITDDTIMKRLKEFKHTDASKLTVTEFLNHGDKLEKNCDPPAFYRQFLPKKKRRRLRKPTGTAADEDSDDDRQPTISRASSVASGRPRRSRREQLDSEAMPPPPVPIDPALLDVSKKQQSERRNPSPGDGEEDEEEDQADEEMLQGGQKRKPGRSRKSKEMALPTPSDPYREDDEEIEDEINAILEDSERLSHTNALHEDLDAIALQEERDAGNNGDEDDVMESTEPITPPVTQRTAPTPAPRPTETTEALLAKVPDSEVIPEDEFASDPEISNCLLTPAECTVKERIWIHENADYLRMQQAKILKAQLAEANGTARVIVRRKRRRARMGDMSKYQRVNEDGEMVGPQTPEEAVAAMLKKRAYSKKINYEAVHHLLGGDGSASGTSSRQGSVTSAGPSTPRIMVTSPTPAALDLGPGMTAKVAVDLTNLKGNEEEEQAQEEVEELDELAKIAEEGEVEDLEDDYYQDDDEYPEEGGDEYYEDDVGDEEA